MKEIKFNKTRSNEVEINATWGSLAYLFLDDLIIHLNVMQIIHYQRVPESKKKYIFVCSSCVGVYSIYL